TIVLVHGAWADSSSWTPVIERLRASDYPLCALPNALHGLTSDNRYLSTYRLRATATPLQGLTTDPAYLSSYLATIDGPIVLVGHSYGGALITNVDASAFDIRALVYRSQEHTS